MPIITLALLHVCSGGGDDRQRGNKMGNEKRVKLTYEQAVEMLADGDFIHTFRQTTGGQLLGSDCPREKVLALLNHYHAELAGETATAMKHGLVLEDNLGYLFLATKEGRNEPVNPADVAARDKENVESLKKWVGK